jgi:hypothetical protein
MEYLTTDYAVVDLGAACSLSVETTHMNVPHAMHCHLCMYVSDSPLISSCVPVKGRDRNEMRH